MKQTFQKIECRLFNHSNDMKCFLICCNSTALWKVFCDVGIQVNISLHHSMKLNIKPSQAKSSTNQNEASKLVVFLLHFCWDVLFIHCVIQHFSLYRKIQRKIRKFKPKTKHRIRRTRPFEKIVPFFGCYLLPRTPKTI